MCTRGPEPCDRSPAARIAPPFARELPALTPGNDNNDNDNNNDNSNNTHTITTT